MQAALEWLGLSRCSVAVLPAQGSAILHVRVHGGDCGSGSVRAIDDALFDARNELQRDNARVPWALYSVADGPRGSKDTFLRSRTLDADSEDMAQWRGRVADHVLAVLHARFQKPGQRTAIDIQDARATST